LYSLALRSRKPEAKAFKRWITHDVLPSIRKHGGYLTPAMTEEVLLNPDTIIRLATALKEERLARARVEEKLTVAEPKAELVDATFAKRSGQLMRLTDVARKLAGVNTLRLKSDLRDVGVLYRKAEQYRVYAKYRDSHFVEKFNPRFGCQDIYATADGAALIARLHRDGLLTLKTSCQKGLCQ
jgi:hypothetical protein